MWSLSKNVVVTRNCSITFLSKTLRCHLHRWCWYWCKYNYIYNMLKCLSSIIVLYRIYAHWTPETIFTWSWSVLHALDKQSSNITWPWHSVLESFLDIKYIYWFFFIYKPLAMKIIALINYLTWFLLEGFILPWMSLASAKKKSHRVRLFYVTTMFL